MRTQDPSNIRTDFDASINDIETAYRAAENGVANDAARKLIAEYLFVAAATLFEGFVSDLFVAYINRDSARFRAHLLGRMSIETDDEYATRSVTHVETSMPHLSVEKTRQVLEPTGYNVTFPTTDEMKKAAGTWLSDADKVRFTKTSRQSCAVINHIKAVRNYLAHRSDNAFDVMQAALAAANLPASLRRGAKKVEDVGVYLRAKHGSQQRFDHVIAEMRALAVQLCP